MARVWRLPSLRPTMLQAQRTLTSRVLLPSTPLPHRGVLITVSPGEAEQFATRISTSLEHWREEGAKSVMLKVPLEESHLAAVAAEHGFAYHHAEGGHAVLKCWLQPDLEDKVPPYATHQVGAAGFVLNQRSELLLVKEWVDTERGRQPGAQWKLPGGLLDRGESFATGVVREVFEETGVRASFKGILSFWHRHGLTFNRSDLYFVARLEPHSEELHPQPCEIADATWMPIDRYIETQDHPLIVLLLRRLYGLERGKPARSGARSREGAPLPLVEMTEEGVQWPGREPYPTFVGTTVAHDAGVDRAR